MVVALDQAEAEETREAIRIELERVDAIQDAARKRRERAVLRNMRKRWSEQFAHACAVMVADSVRAHPHASGLKVLPKANGKGRETFWPLGHNKGKRLDVAASRTAAGLQLGISLKALNFADDANRNYDKNLTGRLYELRDEVSTVHDYLPRAFMTALFFLPVLACFDKAGAPSSFAHTIAELRARTGRLDPSVGAHNWRCDAAAVGLYAAGEPAELPLGLPRGAVRYFPVLDAEGKWNDPPMRGMPEFDRTLDLEGLTNSIVKGVMKGTVLAQEYSAPAAGMVVALAGVAATGAAAAQDEDDEPDDEEDDA